MSLSSKHVLVTGASGFIGSHLCDRLLQAGQITDEARRRIERELDLEEAAITLKREDEDDPPL